MQVLSIFLIGLAMSTDAFAASVVKGAAMPRPPRLPQALRTGLLFGVIEAVTPLIGWLLGQAAARYITAWDHWIAFIVLGLLGLHMIWHGLNDEASDSEGAASRTGFWAMSATALGTSIDAMAVGVSFAFLDAPILLVAAVIGACTLVMVTLGVMLGRALGVVAGKRAELAGGVVMILIGAAILYEHLSGAA